MEEYLQENVGSIEVGYLLSIDRRLGVEEAEDTVNLAIEYHALPGSRVLGTCACLSNLWRKTLESHASGCLVEHQPLI